jgi:hypothetical protein
MRDGGGSPFFGYAHVHRRRAVQWVATKHRVKSKNRSTNGMCAR